MVKNKYPINIKTSSLNSADNSGNMLMCLYAYTNEQIRLKKNMKTVNISEKLIHNIKNKNYNYD